MATFSQPTPLPPLPQPLLTPTPPKPPGDTPPEGEAPAAPLDYKPRPSFFQQPWVQNALPFATSLILHLSIILVVVVFFKVAPSVIKAVKEQIIVPDAAMVNDAPVGGVQNPGLGSDPNRAAAQDKVEAADSSGLNDKKPQSLSQSLMGGGAADGAADNVIGLGAHTGIGSGNGVGAAMGQGTGEGTGDGGALSPFGVPGGGGGLGPKSPFMGISGNGRRIIYLVDASGSMLGVFKNVQDQLMQSIGRLQPVQAFNIIVFHEDETDLASLSRSGLVMANPENKIAAKTFVDSQYAAHGTDPIPGIKLAFAQQPDLVYVLTDGFDNVESYKAIIDLFHNLNTGHAKVDAIMLKSRDDPELVHVLKAITDDARGTFKIIDEKDL